MSWGKSKIEHHYTIVELDKKPLTETSESVAAVQSLSEHAGFQWLLQKLRAQGARLSSELLTKRHADIREVEFLQSGLQWCNWLQQQLDLSNTRFRQMRSPTPQEEMHFQDIESAIELIGKTRSQVE